MVIPTPRTASLEARVRDALRLADTGSSGAMCHGRCSLAALILLQVLRVVAYTQNMLPPPSLLFAHLLSLLADVVATLCALPLFAVGIRSRCVQQACLGPMLTMVFAMMILDCSGLAVYCVMIPHLPPEPSSAPLLVQMAATADMWTLVLVSSVALEVSLAVACWRIYRQLRYSGLYPPNMDSLVKDEPVEYVSMMELVCEPDDLEAMNKCCDVQRGDSLTTEDEESGIHVDQVNRGNSTDTGGSTTPEKKATKSKHSLCRGESEDDPMLRQSICQGESEEEESGAELPSKASTP